MENRDWGKAYREKVKGRYPGAVVGLGGNEEDLFRK